MASWHLPQNPEEALIMPVAYSCQYDDYGAPYYQPQNMSVSAAEEVHRSQLQKVSEHSRLESHLSMYGHPNHISVHNGSTSSSPVHTSSGPMLVVPQPISAMAKSSGLCVPTPSQPDSMHTTGRKYNCKMCPQLFHSKADLQLHTQIHMREAKPYKCPQCHKCFANSSYLSQHARIHAGIKPYKCEVCQRRFTQLSHLQQHMRTHTGDKPYKCRHPGCTKAFTQLSNLQSHSRCHQTDKPYKCNSCYKCYATEQELLEHIPKHKESKHLKTHICQYCGKSYTQETYLTRHLQKHANDRGKRLPPAAVAPVPVKTEPDQYAGWGVPAGSRGPEIDARELHESAMAPLGMHAPPPAAMHLAPPHDEDVLRVTHALHRDDLRHALDSPYHDHQAVGKTSSAFTPIGQSQMMAMSPGALGPSQSLMSIPTSNRPYFPYESISYPKAPPMSHAQMEAKQNMFPYSA